MLERVLEMAKSMGAGEEEQMLRPLAHAAVAEISGWLKAETAIEDCADAFAIAAAWLVLEGLEVSTGGEVKSFHAGDLTIQRAAESKWREKAMTLMRPYRKNGFAFREVRG